ncbi:glycosyltransferase [Rhodobacteraceae bacterium B1Z28]|uniref:Glycosyltransferase n=1 Tax=Ruegeria haliotis TaxID=2747601 RepID=A0ABX2PUJ3_9RHOB|nr:glycosyltransferase [Ruegeria haliotis]NVO57331.1 glycosyltransferase [Ruegeria haliotis]
MRILFGSAHPYLPQMYGGAQASTHELVTRLRARGHTAAVLSGLTGDGWLGLRSRLLLKLRRRGYVRDVSLGYPVFRAWFAQEVARQVVSDFNADVAVFQSRLPVQLAQAINRTRTKTFIYLRNVEDKDLGGPLVGLSDTGFIANSAFTARRYAETQGVAADVIYPMIEAEKYRVTTTRENVTFINPHPNKGVDVALKIAKACPDIPFVFQRGWGLTPEQETHLQTALSGLPNVALKPSTDDMRSVYSKARILLAPSQWEEAFGRIAAEAQISGIPVVASKIGGLPEAVGPGGVLVDRDAPIETWVEAVRTLWHDKQVYERLSAAAFEHAGRPEMAPDRQVDRLLEILNRPPG